MKICLWCMIIFGALLCVATMVISWLMFDYRAAAICFCGMISVIGYSIAGATLEKIADEETYEDDANDD